LYANHDVPRHRFQDRQGPARTGKELWSAELDGNAGSTPLTYLGKNGKQ
jgi:hypothetical protein